MAKNRPSLESFAQTGNQAQQEPVKAPPTAEAPAKVVEFRAPPAEKPKAERKDRPHTTLYLDKKVQKVIKEIALQFDRKPHDLYLEGIDLMLTHYGRPSLKTLAE